MTTIPVAVLEAQLEGIFRAWGMADDYRATCVRQMLESDMMGIDSHGVGMLPAYENNRVAGRLVVNPEVLVVRDAGAVAQLDGGHGMGHIGATRGMELAMAKAREFGIGAVNVRNSNHFGAAGVYSNMARRESLIGLCVTGTTQRSVVPTFGKEPRFSTNPIAFAAPGKSANGFSLDMATSTVAVGKLRIAERANEPIPPGWSIDESGAPETDPAAALAASPKRLTPLGGTRTLGSHKGYGLAMMVEILASVLGGSFIGGHELPGGERGDFINVGHFFLAIAPSAFGLPDHDFADYLDTLTDYLRATMPVDPAQPVMVPGDPEWAAHADRSASGIPMTAKLMAEVREVCASAEADYVLERG